MGKEVCSIVLAMSGRKEGDKTVRQISTCS